MALLKDLIVQGASRFIGDAYFATIKAGVWNGTPIDLSHGGTAGTTTANKVLLSTTTSGISAWSAWTSAGFLKTNASGVVSIDTNTYITGNQTITLSGAVSGSGTTSITTSYAGTVPINKGGTNATTVAGARGNLGTWALILNGGYNTLIASDGSTNGWIKIGTANTSYGLLPSQSGNAGNGHNYIGSSGWYWKYAYIDEIHGSLLGTASYASNVGAAGTAGTNYVTASKVIATCNWYDTMIASSDTDELINRWNEVVDFLNGFTEEDTLASVLSTYVTLGTEQTITGAKTFSNPISGDLLGNATTADRLKSTTDVGGAGTPVYFSGGLPVACTAANVRTFLGLGTVYSHAHTDYVTSISFDTTNRKLQQSKGGDTATNIVTFGTAYSKNIDNSTAGYAAYYSAASTVSGTSLLQFNTTNSTITSSGTIVASNTSQGGSLEIWRKTDALASEIKYYNGATTKVVLGGIGIAGSNGTIIAANRPYWYNSSSYYQIVHSTAKTAVGGSGTPVYVDANGQLQTCTAYSSASVNYATSSGQVRTQSRSTDAVHYLTFVDSNNSSATAETVYTDAGITYNPSTNLLTVEKLTASGVVNLSGSTTIDSLTAGNLIVTGASSLTGDVSMGTVTAGTWNGSVIDVAHGGTGCSTLTSGAALIGNGTGDVTFRSITNNTSASVITANTNLITANTLAYWNGAYSGTSSRLAYCNQGAFGTATTRAYATAIAVGTGTASATANNHASDTYVPTTKAVYNFVTTTLAVSPTISKASITKSLNSSTWTETGYTLYGEEQGSYMLQITDTTTAAVFTGVFSVYHSSSATGNDLDEIPLHMCASTTNKVRIYAATQNGKLLVSSQDTSATNHALTIKYKKIL